MAVTMMDNTVVFDKTRTLTVVTSIVTMVSVKLLELLMVEF